MAEAPHSALSRTSTARDELDVLDAHTFDTINLEELEMKIGLAARIILEHSLRSKGLPPKDKCDIALRAITVLEGSKQEVTWRDELRKKPRRVTMKAYEAERRKVAAELLKVATRNKEVQVVQAEEALRRMGEKDEQGEN